MEAVHLCNGATCQSGVRWLDAVKFNCELHRLEFLSQPARSSLSSTIDYAKGKHTCFNHSITDGWFCSGHILQEKRVGHVSWSVEPEGTILMGGFPDYWIYGIPSHSYPIPGNKTVTKAIE